MTREIEFGNKDKVDIVLELGSLENNYGRDFSLKVIFDDLDDVPDWFFDLMTEHKGRLTAFSYNLHGVNPSGIVVDLEKQRKEAALRIFANPPLAMSEEDFMREIWPHHGDI